MTEITETKEQRNERVLQHLTAARARMEQDVATTTDPTLRRIEVDAATIVTLSLVCELLPTPIQQQVNAVIQLHENTWNTDMLSANQTTPRKPLGQRLLNSLSDLTKTLRSAR